MRKIYLMLAALLCGVAGFGQQAPAWEWDAMVSWTVQGYGGPYLKVFKDNESNFYSIENFSTVKKYNKNKILQWSRNFSGSFVNSIVCSNDGEIYISGNFRNTLSVSHQTLHCEGDLDIFLAKLESNGNVSWIKRIGSKYIDQGGDICIDNDYIYMTGQTTDTIHFNNTIIPKNSGNDLFIAKLDHSGELVSVKFSQTVGPTGDEIGAVGMEIKLGQNGKIHILTRVHGSISYGDTLISGTYSDFILRLDHNFNLEWYKSIGAYYYSVDFDLCVDSKGNMIYASQHYSNHEDPGGCITKLSPSGEILWAQCTNFNNTVTGIDVDPSDNVFYTGWKVREASIPPSTELVVVKYYMLTGMKTSNGENVWTKLDSANTIISGDIKILSDNEVLVGGNFSDTLILKNLLVSPGNSFLASLHSPGSPVIVPIIKNIDMPTAVYPNPSSGKFFVNGFPDNTEIKVYDPYGKCLYCSKNNEIDLTTQAKGIYFLEGKSKEGIVRRKLIVE